MAEAGARTTTQQWRSRVCSSDGGMKMLSRDTPPRVSYRGLGARRNLLTLVRGLWGRERGS